MRIDNDGVGLEVVVDGPADGPPVLFLHGISGSSATYDFLVPRYPRHRIHRLDKCGHGRSDRAPGHYVMDDFASDAEAVLAAVGPMLQPDRELGAAFFDDHATQLGTLNPQIEVVRVHGVGHLIHDSLTHRDEYLAQLDRFLATYAPA